MTIARVTPGALGQLRERLPGPVLTVGGWLRRSGVGPQLLTLAMVAAIFTIGTGGRYLAWSNVQVILSLAAIPAIFAVGLHPTIVAGGIDLSLGGVASLCAVFVGMLVKNQHNTHDVGLWIIPIGMALGAASGVVSGLLNTVLRIPSFIATLGMSWIVLGIAVYLGKAVNVQLADTRIGDFVSGNVLGVPQIAIVAVLFTALVQVVEDRTRFGRYMYVIGGDEGIARQAGVNVARHKVLLFTVAGVIYGLASVLLTCRLGIATSRMGLTLLFPGHHRRRRGWRRPHRRHRRGQERGAGRAHRHGPQRRPGADAREPVHPAGGERGGPHRRRGPHHRPQEARVHQVRRVETMGVASGTGEDVVLALRGITKTFPGVVALDDVELVIHRNEVVGLVGENGAGKSVLMKIMVGLVQPDGGTIELEGKRITLRDPSEAIRHGIGMVFQEGALAPNLTVTENLFLRHEERFARMGFFSLRVMRDAARELLAELGIQLDVDQVVSEIGPAARQMVEIARLLWLSRLYGRDNPVLILDEPTAVLGDEDRARLFAILRELKKRASVVFITHRLQELVENCDRVCILKDGKNVAVLSASEAGTMHIERLMVGHSFSADRFHEDLQRGSRGGREVLEVEGLSRAGHFAPISFTIREGEIVALIGLVGSGKEEICKCVAGTERADAGRISVGGEQLPLGSPRSAVLAGIGHVPVDRRSEGLALMMSVASNVNLLVLGRLKRAGLLSPSQERANARHWVAETQIKTPSLSALCANLSGGNQQKIVISKWLSSKVRLLVLDHPTRGVDVGAKDEIYKLMRKLAGQGIGMMVMCDTLEEDIGLADRLLVMKDGQLVQEVASPPGGKPSPQHILSLIV